MNVKYFDLKDKKVLVTDGGSGIGATIVEYFCEQEAEVFFIDYNVKESKKLIQKINKKKLRLPKFYKCNLININKLQSIIKKIISKQNPDKSNNFIQKVSQTVKVASRDADASKNITKIKRLKIKIKI